MTEPEFPIFCADCGTRGTVTKIAAGMLCRCGSANLGLVGVDDMPKTASFNDTHVENYRRWAQQEGREPEHVKTLKAYEKQPGIGRAHANFLADQLYVGGGESNWRQEGHRDAAKHTAAPQGPGTGWTGPDPRRLEGWNEYPGPGPQTYPRSAPVADSTTCPVCHGTGYDLIDKTKCRECGGTGTITHPTGKPPVETMDPGRALPGGGAHWAGRRSTDPHGSVQEHIQATTPGFGERGQSGPARSGPFDPEDAGTFYPKAQTRSPHMKDWSPAKSAPEGPYRMDAATCPNCGTRPTELVKDKNEDAWWHCSNCGPLANIDRHPEVNPYSPPEGFRPDRSMKTGGFLARNKKTGRLMSMLAVIHDHNELNEREAVTLARTSLQHYGEGR